MTRRLTLITTFLSILITFSAVAQDKHHEDSSTIEAKPSFQYRLSSEAQWQNLGIYFDEIFDKVSIPTRINPSAVDEIQELPSKYKTDK